jgi:hypothetical protein
MNKTTNSGIFLDFAYSPRNDEFTQRIINPEKKKKIFFGKRYLKEINDNEIKILRKKTK